MLTRWMKTFAVICGLCALAAAPAEADPLLVPFDISVGSSHGDMTLLFGVPIAGGDLLHGTLTYDRDQLGVEPQPGFRLISPADGSVTFDIGAGLAVPLDTIDVYDTIPNQSPFDSDTLALSATTSSVPGFDSAFLTLDFQGPPSSRSTDTLPRSVAEIAAFATHGSISFNANQTGVSPPFDDTTHAFLGTVRLAEQPTPTPEPMTGLLLVSGALGFVAVGRRHLL